MRADSAGVPAEALVPYGSYKAKVDVRKMTPTGRTGRLVLVSAMSPTPAGEGLRVPCAPAEVGRAALQAGVVLTDLRSGSGGLEDLFLELTEDTQREGQPVAATQQGATA